MEQNPFKIVTDNLSDLMRRYNQYRDDKNINQKRLTEILFRLNNATNETIKALLLAAEEFDGIGLS